MLAAHLFLLAAAGTAYAHTAAFAPGMYCRGGPNPNVDDQNTNTVVNPLYQLLKSRWWMQADRGCNNVPPKNGESLALPAGGSFTVELAHNRAQTTLSYGGQFTSDWPDGQSHPEDWSNNGECLSDGAMHTKSRDTAAGTAFAISYQSDITKVTMENLVVFSVAEHTPWKRVQRYDVPRDLPPCPVGGCYCAWLWVPDGCGEPNMYMQNFKCHVTGSTSSRRLAPAQTPVWCAGNPGACRQGAKQMIVFQQAEGNNVQNLGGNSPGYNSKLGWSSGAQNDIFA